MFREIVINYKKRSVQNLVNLLAHLNKTTKKASPTTFAVNDILKNSQNNQTMHNGCKD